MGFPTGRNTGVGRYFLLQGIFLDLGIEPVSLTSALAGRPFTLAQPWGSPMSMGPYVTKQVSPPWSRLFGFILHDSSPRPLYSVWTAWFPMTPECGKHVFAWGPMHLLFLQTFAWLPPFLLQSLLQYHFLSHVPSWVSSLNCNFFTPE